MLMFNPFVQRRCSRLWACLIGVPVFELIPLFSSPTVLFYSVRYVFYLFYKKGIKKNLDIQHAFLAMSNITVLVSTNNPTCFFFPITTYLQG